MVFIGFLPKSRSNVSDECLRKIPKRPNQCETFVFRSFQGLGRCILALAWLTMIGPEGGFF